MTGITKKAMLAGLGVFLGLVFFGVSVSLTHFNRLVAPQQPLQLLEWRMEEEQLCICIMGEDLYVKVDREWPVKLGQQVNEKLVPGIYEIRDWFAVVQQELRDHKWLEKAEIATQKIQITMEKYKKIIWD